MGRHREFDVDEALQAALRVFWAKGYEGASYDDLTRAAGIARPGLYSAFGNKEALFLLALDRYHADCLSFVGEAMAQPTSLEVVRCFLNGTVDLVTAFPQTLGCLGVNASVSFAEPDDRIRRQLIARRRSTEGKLYDRPLQAQSEKDLPGTADAKALAGYVATVSQGIAVQARAGVDRSALRAIALQVETMWPR